MKNSENKICQNCKKDFTIESEDFNFYEKIKVPTPTFCPQCRYQRRLANRNEWNFYKRDCSLCGKDMVSIYNKEYTGPVYCQPCYWSDKWNSLDYGRDFDFSRPFFEQFYEHRFNVPRVTLANEGSVNSEYTNQSNNNKNCYMVVATNACEYCIYGNWNQNSRECSDCSIIKECELLYESIDCLKCYRSSFLETCSNMSDSWFCSDCKGGTNCFGCVNLRNKSYCWFNEQLTKEEWTNRFSEIKWTTKIISDFYKKFQEFRQKLPVRYYHGVQILNCSGDYIGFSKNMHNSFNCFHSENLSYGQDAWEARDCRDLTETLDNELDYEMEGAGWGGNNISSCKHWYSSRILYSELTFHSEDLFGCVSMIKKKHCIFNKQYSKKDFLILKDKIIEHMKTTGEWGEFFPVSISPFPYNDSLAYDYFPMNKNRVLEKGWRWYERPPRDYMPTIYSYDLPNTSKDFSDDILGETISCSTQNSEENKKIYKSCTTAFRLNTQELIFYRKMGLPIPNKCYRCRLQDRLERRNPRKLWHRTCMCDKENHIHKGKCKVEFETSYSPERPEIVYCEKCYQQEVY